MKTNKEKFEEVNNTLKNSDSISVVDEKLRNKNCTIIALPLNYLSYDTNEFLILEFFGIDSPDPIVSRVIRRWSKRCQKYCEIINGICYLLFFKKDNRFRYIRNYLEKDFEVPIDVLDVEYSDKYINAKDIILNNRVLTEENYRRKEDNDKDLKTLMDIVNKKIYLMEIEKIIKENEIIIKKYKDKKSKLKECGCGRLVTEELNKIHNKILEECSCFIYENTIVFDPLKRLRGSIMDTNDVVKYYGQANLYNFQYKIKCSLREDKRYDLEL